MDISIIIPALNEQNKIGRDIMSVSHFLVEAKLAGEIIIVDDGSTDDTSQRAIQYDVPDPVSFKIIRYERHRGKGYAVRMGIGDSRGDYVMFMDSGGNVPPSYISRGLDMIKAGKCEIAMGSRRLPQSKIHKHLTWYRRISSFLFRNVVRIYLNIPRHLTDTQCGFKIYKGDIGRELYQQCKSEGFIFDLEIILRAQKAEYRMLEFPLDWTCDRDSRLSMITTPKLLRELIRIKKITA
jgi:dolichyl-phosphate beta-glucosyltransferase